MEKIHQIQEKIKAAKSRQKSYANKRRNPLEFSECDHVFLKVTPSLGVSRALCTKKLSPRFIGPFQIFERIGSAAYRITLPPSLSNLHNVFQSTLEVYSRSSSTVKF